MFWFSHNLDFRGRTYAIPPHFNHLGGDTSRAIIQFAKGKPLGPNGLNWIKIHLVNLTGLKKRSSNAERLQYADEKMADILDSADKPLNVSSSKLIPDSFQFWTRDYSKTCLKGPLKKKTKIGFQDRF